MKSITPKLAIRLLQILPQRLLSMCMRGCVHAACVCVCVCVCVYVCERVGGCGWVGVFFQTPAHFGCVVLVCIVFIFSLSKVTERATYSLSVWSHNVSSDRPGVAMYSRMD